MLTREFVRLLGMVKGGAGASIAIDDAGARLGAWRPRGKVPSKPRLDPVMAWRITSTRITDIEDVRQDVARARRIRHGVARRVCCLCSPPQDILSQFQLPSRCTECWNHAGCFPSLNSTPSSLPERLAKPRSWQAQSCGRHGSSPRRRCSWSSGATGSSRA
jgi:hypothetical protein